MLYGTSATSLSQAVSVTGPSTTSTVISGLTIGATYYFAVSTVNSAGQASNSSSVAAVTIQ